MTSPQCVLVIDGAAETADVLQAVLGSRGTVVQRTRTHAVARRPVPQLADVVVVDVDSKDDALGDAWEDTPRVVLSSKVVAPLDPQTRFLQKPFQYPELVRAVQDLLGATSTVGAAALRDLT